MTFKSLPLIGLALALSACGTVNRGLESVHQPVVQRTDYVIDLASSGDRLAPGERDRLDGWFRSIDLSYGDRVSIDDPSGGYGVRSDVDVLLNRRGMASLRGAPVTPGAVPPGSVRVVVSRATASVPGCPDWSRPSSPEFVGSTTSNYGCATNAALASMVADPTDLIQGREAGTALDTVVSSKAIRVYRDAAPTGTTGLKNETTKKGQ
ncbi:CpaD family pilus assembly protein [Sphingomonas tabacisoli]|uniref:CpaD family pilus assembly protein n=1 Tax=Sphingomonas tabacisoli TaxID=2249466 RepID=A0ABW4I672_9SPHN